MSSDLALALSAFGIGVVAGLRSLTSPAVVSWAAHFHRLDLRDSRLALLGSDCGLHDFRVGSRRIDRGQTEFRAEPDEPFSNGFPHPFGGDLRRRVLPLGESSPLGGDLTRRA